MRGRAAFAAVATLALPGCVAAADCVNAIPEDLRADAVRFAVDRKLVGPRLVPRDDMALALGAGEPYAQLTEERRRLLAPHAAGYASCIRELVNR